VLQLTRLYLARKVLTFETMVLAGSVLASSIYGDPKFLILYGCLSGAIWWWWMKYLRFQHQHRSESSIYAE
jgi:hypothetical protein